MSTKLEKKAFSTTIRTQILAANTKVLYLDHYVILKNSR